MVLVAFAFLTLATIGVGLVAVQGLLVRRFLRQPVRQVSMTHRPGISILKPLCGLDEALEENLRSWAELDYPEYEVLLGFHSQEDPAMPLARACEARWPNRFRIVLQEGEPGLNPKVNQLITLCRAARHGIVVVSDASVRAVPGYLPEIAAHFEDEAVGLVTHPVAAVGERSAGALFDNLYLMTHFSTGMIAAKVASGQDMVLGKSMAFRKADLEALGGFEAAKDHLAEDFILGRWVPERLGKRVVFARSIPQTVSVNLTVRGFIDRYQRWSVLQRNGVGVPLYVVQTFMYPLLHATMGLALAPSRWTLLAWIFIALSKGTLDVWQARMFRGGDLPWRKLFLSPVHDLLVAWAWFHGLRYDRVFWRGRLYEITRGTKLVPLGSEHAGDEELVGEEPSAT